MTYPLIPSLKSLKGYTTKKAIGDAIAGTILAILLVPQAMAYAQLAGLPPQTGLYAAILPPLLYLFFGTSPFVSVGPVALISLVIAQAAGDAGTEPITAAAIVGIQAGALLVLLGALNLGRLINFISEPILLGFTAAVAILICMSQVPTLIGTNPERAGNLPDAFVSFWSVLPEWRPATAAIGTGALVALILLDRYAAPLAWKLGIRPPWRQAIAKSLPLAVLVIAAVTASMVPADVARISEPSGGLPTFSVPSFNIGVWLTLLPSAAVVALIIFATATAVAKSLAGPDRSGLSTNREATALGLGNMAAAMSGGYAVSASLSRSALVEDSGGRTPLAHVIGALLVLATLLFLAPILAYLPQTALAALVISAVFGLIKVKEISRVWDHDRLEGALIAITFIATLLLGVKWGLAVGTFSGIAHHLWFSSLPRITQIGTNDDGRTFRSIERDEIDPYRADVLALRIDRSLFFANSAYVEDELFRMLNQHGTARCLVVDMRAVNTVDASAAEMLSRMADRLNSDDVQLRFAATHEPVRNKLDRLNSNYCAFHRTVGDAMEACSQDGSVIADDR